MTRLSLVRLFEGLGFGPESLPPGLEHLDVPGRRSPSRLSGGIIFHVESPPGGLARSLVGNFDKLLVQREVVSDRILKSKS